MKERKCTATRRDGSACQARALPNSERCWAHDPSLTAKRRAAHSAGGQGKGRGQRAQRLLPTQLRSPLDLLIQGMDEVYRGVLEPTRYSAMASGAGAIARLFQLAEMEERLVALERSHEGGSRDRVV